MIKTQWRAHSPLRITMDFFSQQYSEKYYVANTQSGDVGFLAYILPDASSYPGTDLKLDDALTNKDYNGSFVFSMVTPDISTKEAAEAFVQAVHDTVIKPSASDRGMIWLKDPSNITSSNSSIMGLSPDGSQVSSALQAALTMELTFNVATAMPLELNDTTLTMGTTVSSQSFTFSGPSSPSMIQSTRGELDFSGGLRGCIQFPTYIKRQSLQDDLKWGFQFLFPNDAEYRPALSEWLPLASTVSGASDQLGFNISIDPSDPYNDHSTGDTIAAAYATRRTYFDFTGKNFNQNDTTLVSQYRTVFGDTLYFLPVTTTDNDSLPARLVLSLGEDTSSTTQNFHVAPEGDFIIQNGASPDGSQVNMICGLQGTEFFTVTTADTSGVGDKFRFLSNMPAYSDKFPFKNASPVAAPPPLSPDVINGQYKTSWATIIPGGSNPIMYVAQPQGSALFGKDSIQKAGGPVYGHTTPGFEFLPDDNTTFPMVPYNGLIVKDGTTGFSQDQSEKFESQIISGMRRNLVSKISGSMKKNLLNSNAEVADGEETTTTTPSGLLATLSGSEGAYDWDKVLLGQNNIDGSWLEMYFASPDDTLLQALQTSDLFMVTTNNAHLGEVEAGSGPGFFNKMQIGDWGIQANVGSETSVTYNDYRNIMIIKGRSGALYDPGDGTTDPDGLVMNPDKWTSGDVFADPSGPNTDASELIIVSQWLQTYFQKAADKSDNPYFKQFNKIAKDENWTGILFLRVDIDVLPTNLTGIMAGVRYPQDFNAHHFAIEISPVSTGDKGPQLDHASSMFGLIYYEDQKFVDQTPVQPVAPRVGKDYDFCLLTLKVLFENTTVKSFESYAQLTTNKLFGSVVTDMGKDGNPYKTAILKGSLQITNGQAVYSLGSDSDNCFYFNSNILNKIEITDVLLSTRDDGEKSGNIVCWFGMSGFLDFQVLSSTDEGIFDIFSFGNEDRESKLRKGLSFSNLGVQMEFSKAAQEAAEKEQKQVDADFTFVTDEIRFDLSKSTPRAQSLDTSLALDLQGLVAGTAEEAPDKLGYLQVLSNLRLSSVGGGDWYGLKFQMNMGTPGELAGKVNLTSYLLVAWSPNSAGDGYTAQLGIEMPGTGGGAKLISLQSVLKLSIGQIKLIYNADQKAFLLMMTEIALKFLGILKIPPAGSTLFYLFGNPQGGGKPSGLGWYAQYTNVPKSGGSETELKAIEPTNDEQTDLTN